MTLEIMLTMITLKQSSEETVEENDLIIIPIEETKYLYHYGFPNVFIWLYPF